MEIVKAIDHDTIAPMTLFYREIESTDRMKARGEMSATRPSCWDLGVQKFQ
jgi:hypothetical protein